MSHQGLSVVQKCPVGLHPLYRSSNKEVPELAASYQGQAFHTGSPRVPFVACSLKGQKYELFIAASVYFENSLRCLRASVDIFIVYCVS